MFHAHHHLYAWRWWKPRGSERAWGLLEPELQAPMICSAISVLGTEPRSCARAAVIALQPLSALSMYKTLNLVGFYLFLMDVFSLRFVGFCFFFSQSLNSFCLVPCVHCVFSLECLYFYLYFSILGHSSWAVALMTWSDRQSFHHLCFTVGCLVFLRTAGY